jgi:hypothetical protein
MSDNLFLQFLNFDYWLLDSGFWILASGFFNREHGTFFMVKCL